MAGRMRLASAFGLAAPARFLRNRESKVNPRTEQTFDFF
jgi:hypothetical protein